MPTEIRPLKTKADYGAALKDIERYFEHQPEPALPRATGSTSSHA